MSDGSGMKLREQSGASALLSSFLRMSRESATRQSPAARWNPVNRAWMADQGSLFCVHWVPWQEIFPKCAIIRDGFLYPQVPSVLPMNGSASSYLLPTPTATLNAPPKEGWKPDLQWWLQSRAMRNLEAVVTGKALLPTPRSSPQENRQTRRTPSQSAGTHGLCLAGEAGEPDTWSQYIPAIKDWEAALGRPAPPHVKPDKNGNDRLNTRFTEFMQGLPDGWVCDTPGLSREDEIRILGNGVIPRQAAMALRILLGEQ